MGRVQRRGGGVGEGSQATGEKNPAESFKTGSPLARQSRSLLPPDRQYQLPAHGSAFHDASPGDDRALLSRLFPDALHRLASVLGLHLLGLQLLSRRAKRAAP